MKLIAIFALIFGCVITASASPASVADAPPLKPNIVFIFVDDAGIGDFSAYGCKYGVTPNIDRMAAEGMKFTRAYSGSAVCAPSRCVLMTGQHTGHILRRANQSKHGLLALPEGQMTVARLLQEAGYATGGFGKWGLGNPGTTGAAEKQGFDLFFGYYDQKHAHDFYTDYLVRNGVDEPMPQSGRQTWEDYSHTRIADETLKFIEQNKDRQFFCYAAWTPPHGDYVIPDNTQYSEEPWPETVRNYAAMVGLIDKDVGRLLQKIKDLGIDDNTLVIFSSDNGANKEFIETLASTGGLRGAKRMLYEGGIRTPFIARWPGKVPPGTTSDLLTSSMDFLPTAAELAGVPVPRSTSRSMNPTSSRRCASATGKAIAWAQKRRLNSTTLRVILPRRTTWLPAIRISSGKSKVSWRWSTRLLLTTTHPSNLRSAPKPAKRNLAKRNFKINPRQSPSKPTTQHLP